jgi:hypothetical protein
MSAIVTNALCELFQDEMQVSVGTDSRHVVVFTIIDVVYCGNPDKDQISILELRRFYNLGPTTPVDG